MDIQDLCRQGAFSQFLQVMNSLNEPAIEYGKDVVYQLGKRDGVREFKDDLVDTINRIAKNGK